MHAPPPARTRVLRLAAAAFAGGLVMSVAPLPTFDFVPAASAQTASVTSFRSVAAAVVAEQQADTAVAVGDDRVAAVEPDTDGFTMIGATLPEPPTEPVLVRVREADGGWSEWNELEVDPDKGPEPGSAEDAAAAPAGPVVTEPLWVDDATGYEISVGRADSAAVEVSVVREETRRVVAESVPMADAAVAAPFGINSRASWGARAPSSSPSLAPSVNLAVVHHTAGSNDYTQSQVPSIIRGMQAYHMDTNGWSDIAYNFLVDKFGGIWEGRAGGTTNAVIGAHARGFNTGSVGVSVLGNYVGVSSTAAARESVSRVVGYRLHLYGVNPTHRVNVTSLGSTTIPEGRVVNLPTVIGHKDVGSTECPGSLYSNLGSIRNRALEWYKVMDTLVSPSGAISSVKVNGRRIDVIGWARDPDVAAAARVHVVVAGRLSEVFANGYRPDVGKVYPGYGDHLGWSTSFSNLPPGEHRLCVTVINQGLGNDKLVGCRDVVIK